MYLRPHRKKLSIMYVKMPFLGRPSNRIVIRITYQGDRELSGESDVDSSGIAVE
jgi:hypothetical protein